MSEKFKFFLYYKNDRVPDNLKDTKAAISYLESIKDDVSSLTGEKRKWIPLYLEMLNNSLIDFILLEEG